MAGFLGPRHHGLEVGQTVVPVHLHGVVHHHTVAVVVRHHVFGKAVDGILDPRFFRVDHHASTGRGRGFAQGTDAPLDAHPCRLVFSAQGFAARHGLPHFFKQGVGRQSAHLEYGKGMAGVAVRSLNRREDFAARRVEVGLGGLAFRAVIQNGAHVVGPKLLDGVLRICDGFPPQKCAYTVGRTAQPNGIRSARASLASALPTWTNQGLPISENSATARRKSASVKC